VFAPFEATTGYFAADKQFILNLRVSDPDANATDGPSLEHIKTSLAVIHFGTSRTRAELIETEQSLAKG
jgi:hypothetical protein